MSPRASSTDKNRSTDPAGQEAGRQPNPWEEIIPASRYHAERERVRRRRATRGRRRLVRLALLLLVALTVAWVEDRADAGSIGEGMTVGGVDIGGLLPPQAATRLEKRLIRWDAPALVVRDGRRSFRLTARRARIRVDVSATVGAALERSRGGTFVSRAVRDLLGRSPMPLRVRYSKPAVRRFVGRVAHETRARTGRVVRRDALEREVLDVLERSLVEAPETAAGTLIVGLEDAMARSSRKMAHRGNAVPSTERRLSFAKAITGDITPKSIVASEKGLFLAQNMMYRHTVTVYDRKHRLVKTIPDTIRLAKFGFRKFNGNYHGAPVEAAFAPDGKHAYVSNYAMYGAGFTRPGDDACSPDERIDESFLYRIDAGRLKVDEVIRVGSVPKAVAVSPDNRLVLASNWCSWDLSVIDARKGREVKRVPLGRYPRGIVVDRASETAYVAIMGTTDIAKVDLDKFTVTWIRNVGRGPRHLAIARGGRYLYATLNHDDGVAKIDLRDDRVVARANTGDTPRSAAMSDDGQSLYVVNYKSDTVSKVRTSDMEVLQTVETEDKPIGITYDPATRQLWVACYSGSIMVFKDE